MSRFGRQPDGMYYNGIDIAAQEGEPVVAAADGKVTFSAYLKDYGETIIIQHENHFSTVYTHLGRRMTQQQDRIMKGERIGVVGKPVGKKDACLNFGIWYKYKARDPLVFLP
jgi:lipoprotein NlpD